MENIFRKDQLEYRLKLRGLKFRDDSYLSNAYVQGKTDLNIDFVVERMCQMKYLYEYCNMKNIKSMVYEEYIEQIKLNNKPNSCLLSETKISLLAEKIALDTYNNGVYPDEFPWETNNNYLKNTLDWTFTKIQNNKLMFGIITCTIPIVILFAIKNNKFIK